MTDRYDAVIIGAGPSGLAAGARMAHFGHQVLIVEAHSRIGGLNSWYSRGGREISAGLHAFTNYSVGRSGPLAKLFRQLRLSVADLKLYPQRRSSIRFPSVTLPFDNDPATLRVSVATNFPKEIDNFDRLVKRIRETDEGTFDYRPASARAVLEGYLSDTLLVDMLFCPVMYYGNPGGTGLPGIAAKPDMEWLLFCVVWKCMFESGLACPADGMRPLWEMLAAKYQADGGELRLRAPVRRIVSRGGTACGVELESGEEIAAGMIFSSAGRVETRRLAGGPEEMDAAETGSVTIAEGCAFLDRPAEAIGMADTTVFYSTRDELEFSCRKGLISLAGGVLCAPGNYDFPPPGPEASMKMSVLANYAAWRGLAREEYAAAKREAAERMLDAARGLGVDIRAGSAEGFIDFFTPTTLERYARHVGGALYGSPVKSRDGSTALEKLYLIGADQGFHGIVGAMLSGVAMANLHFLGKRG